MTEKMTLTELQRLIRDALYISLPEMYWVIAEISEIRENSSGHCYLELIDKNNDAKNPAARARGIIWNNRYRLLKSYFENMTGESLRSGLKILARVKVEYHELFGLSLVISDIDPSYTIGEMAARRQKIIQQLEEEGVFDMNRETDMPVVPQRIAIISSLQAAGYTDFIKHLNNNNRQYKFHTLLFESALQGVDTERGIITALDRIAENQENFDVVAIIRGGGSQSDLGWFDSYAIAYHITQFPLPVLTGIGHERDMTVTDLVAHKALKTPTAVADFIITATESFEDQITESGRVISELATGIISGNRTRLETASLRLAPITGMMLAAANEKISRKIIGLIDTGKKLIIKAGFTPKDQHSRLLNLSMSLIGDYTALLNKSSKDLQLLSSSNIRQSGDTLVNLKGKLTILDPSNVLKRGYSISTINQKIIKSVHEVSGSDLMTTIFADGKAVSRVEATEEDINSGNEDQW